MAEYRISDRARADLIDIYDFTESRFGAYQADAYYAGLVRSFGLLADFPLIGQNVDELAAGYRALSLSVAFDFLHGPTGLHRNPSCYTRCSGRQTAAL
jgi:plasmid stabilization system protein ParE